MLNNKITLASPEYCRGESKDLEFDTQAGRVQLSRHALPLASGKGTVFCDTAGQIVPIRAFAPAIWPLEPYVSRNRKITIPAF